LGTAADLHRKIPYGGDLKWTVVVTVAMFNMIIGTIWYGPFFGKPWMRIVGNDREEFRFHLEMYVYCTSGSRGSPLAP